MSTAETWSNIISAVQAIAVIVGLAVAWGEWQDAKRNAFSDRLKQTLSFHTRLNEPEMRLARIYLHDKHTDLVRDYEVLTESQKERLPAEQTQAYLDRMIKTHFAEQRFIKNLFALTKLYTELHACVSSELCEWEKSRSLLCLEVEWLNAAYSSFYTANEHEGFYPGLGRGVSDLLCAPT